MKQIDELFMGMSVEDKRAAVAMKRHFQNTGFRPAQPGIGKAVLIGVKAADGFAPSEGRRLGVTNDGHR
jgi:hypothetical protein